MIQGAIPVISRYPLLYFSYSLCGPSVLRSKEEFSRSLERGKHTKREKILNGRSRDFDFLGKVRCRLFGFLLVVGEETEDQLALGWMGGWINHQMCVQASEASQVQRLTREREGQQSGTGKFSLLYGDYYVLHENYVYVHVSHEAT